MRLGRKKLNALRLFFIMLILYNTAVHSERVGSFNLYADKSANHTVVGIKMNKSVLFVSARIFSAVGLALALDKHAYGLALVFLVKVL